MILAFMWTVLNHYDLTPLFSHCASNLACFGTFPNFPVLLIVTIWPFFSLGQPQWFLFVILPFTRMSVDCTRTQTQLKTALTVDFPGSKRSLSHSFSGCFN